MAKRNIIPPTLDITDARQVYEVTKSRDFYKGTSFQMNGKWDPNTHYYNDDFIISFVACDGSLLFCKQNHTSTEANRPIIVKDEFDNVIGIEPSEYWEFILSGLAEVNIPRMREINLTPQINGTRSTFDLGVASNLELDVALYYNGQRLFEPGNFTYNSDTKTVTTSFIPKIGGELYAIIWETSDSTMIHANEVIVDSSTFTQISGYDAQAVFQNTDAALKTINDYIASHEVSLFHTNQAWEAPSLDVLNSWINTTTNTAYDPINGRQVGNFDVYLTLDTNINHYFDAGAWLALIPIPKIPIDIIESWSPDDSEIHVKLSAIPENTVTINSFRVYNTRNGNSIGISRVTGAGVDYTLTIPQQFDSYGITYIS